jgi:tRNA1Val (adenine37-N6)-methyltransferase
LANPYFRFKQFTVYQKNSTLKVCTDACLFGAWVAAELKKRASTPASILDIGTGTGLLALMLAQAVHATIDAVEIERTDFLQAEENIENSSWQSRIHLFLSDVKKFQTPNRYDLIISNPPFFENDLPSEKAGKNRAKHDTHLTLQELFDSISRLLSAKGEVALLLPMRRLNDLEMLCQKFHLHIIKFVEVKNKLTEAPFRIMVWLATKEEIQTKELIYIKEESGAYSDRFIELLKDYYLYL